LGASQGSGKVDTIFLSVFRINWYLSYLTKKTHGNPTIIPRVSEGVDFVNSSTFLCAKRPTTVPNRVLCTLGVF